MEGTELPDHDLGFIYENPVDLHRVGSSTFAISPLEHRDVKAFGPDDTSRSQAHHPNSPTMTVPDSGAAPSETPVVNWITPFRRIFRYLAALPGMTGRTHLKITLSNSAGHCSNALVIRGTKAVVNLSTVIDPEWRFRQLEEVLVHAR